MSTKSDYIYKNISTLVRKIESSNLSLSLLIGKNISFSLSVKVHSLFYQYHGIDKLSYLIYDTLDDCKNPSWNFKQALLLLEYYNVVGINITSPYKIYPFPSTYKCIVDNLNENLDCKLIKDNLHAVNTLVKYDGKSYYTSTDMLGLDYSLKKYGYKNGIEDFSNLIILGSGGMSRSILDFIKDNPNLKVFMLSRSHPDFIDELSFKNLNINCFSLSSDGLKQFIDSINQDEHILIINTLLNSVDTSWCFWVFDNLPSSIKGRICFMDLNYVKSNGSMLEKEASFFKTNSIHFIDGRDMLIAQAVYSEILWNKLSLDKEEFRSTHKFIDSNL